MLKQECRKVDLAESLISSATRRQFAVRIPCTAYWFSPTPRRQLLHPTSTEICFFPGLRRTQHHGRRALTATRTTICIRTLTLDNYCLHRTPSTLHTSLGPCSSSQSEIVHFTRSLRKIGAPTICY